MDKKMGDAFRNLPTDHKQSVTSNDLSLLKEMFAPTKRSKKEMSRKQVESESDSESEHSDSDEEEEDEETDLVPTKKSMWSELKSTFLASLLFVLLNTQIVDQTIKGLGMDGLKLLFIKLFLFAILFFVLRYKFL